MSAARPVLAALAIALGLGLAACSDDDAADAPATTAPPPATTAPAPATTAPGPTARPRAPAPAPAPLPGLPADTAGFEDWTRLNADPIPQDSPQARRVGFDAHGGTKNVYVNRSRAELRAAARGGGRTFPDGSIVVKAAGTGGELTLVAIMRKIQGVDPAHGDWRFIEYKRGGAGEDFATNAGLRDATCWGCHATAESTDWVFTALDP